MITTSAILLPQICDMHHSTKHSLYSFCMFERRFLKHTMPRFNYLTLFLLAIRKPHHIKTCEIVCIVRAGYWLIGFLFSHYFVCREVLNVVRGVYNVAFLFEYISPLSDSKPQFPCFTYGRSQRYQPTDIGRFDGFFFSFKHRFLILDIKACNISIKGHSTPCQKYADSYANIRADISSSNILH